jgi:uncharacterized membrane protein (DUF106 family)
MARIAQKVEGLIRSDPAIAEAIETVIAATADGEDVQWRDVKGEVTSGHWGRLIEKEVLVEGDTGFALADRTATEAGLDVEVAPSVDDEEGSQWSVYDKAAAGVTVVLFLGYSWKPLRDLIGGTMDLIMSPLEAMLPFYAVVMVLALITGLYSTLLQANLMDMEKMGAYQAEMKEIQARRKEAKENEDDAALEAIQAEQMEKMGDQLGMFKEQFRPMVWIMFLTIPAFLWMYWAIGVGPQAEAHVLLSPLVVPLAGEVTWTSGVIGPIQTWIVWYFLCSMAFTQVIRKALDINMSPTAA